jgi:hypothetical protein
MESICPGCKIRCPVKKKKALIIYCKDFRKKDGSN